MGNAPGGVFAVGDCISRWVASLGPAVEQAVVRGRPAAAGPRAGGGPAPLRLTRRGRIVFTMLLTALVGTAVVLLAAPAGRAADPPAPRPTVVVQEGETLWMVAERHAPRRDRFATIEEIRRLNRLNGYGIRAGQRLVLPRIR